MPPTGNQRHVFARVGKTAGQQSTNSARADDRNLHSKTANRRFVEMNAPPHATPWLMGQLRTGGANARFFFSPSRQLGMRGTALFFRIRGSSDFAGQFESHAVRIEKIN